ncbi:hypothetical protein Acor_60200 [Acrocarpospora corrugata]|uniref:Uncharacterized protein n=1 Tax=Acrocarpospora corrugata TaxID=35763 RepID=A0A5M3W593_9ACTN|nr:hypothetical protein [Acrocarpospora corrugata]GES03954.1 hypothetical protein Acor_60200 [Acrocarpospora corrugata]
MAAARRNRISLSRPRHATWMGDAMAAREKHIHGEYGLDLWAAWPRLWLTLPSRVRDEARKAYAAWHTAGVHGGGGLLYLLIAPWWWPALLVAVAGCAAAWWSGRAAWGDFTDLVESLADLYGAALARSLGVPVDTWPDPAIGVEVTARLRKGI